MSEKNSTPNVYFPTDEAGRMAMVSAIDNYLGEGKKSPQTVGVAIPKKPSAVKGKKTLPVIESDKKDE